MISSDHEKEEREQLDLFLSHSRFLPPFLKIAEALLPVTPCDQK